MSTAARQAAAAAGVRNCNSSPPAAMPKYQRHLYGGDGEQEHAGLQPAVQWPDEGGPGQPAAGAVREQGPGGETLRPAGAQLGARLSAARAAELRERLISVVDEFEADDADGVEVRAFIAFFCPEPRRNPSPGG